MDLLAELTKPGVRRDPHPLFGYLRNEDPVHLSAAGFYVVSRYDDAKQILRQTGTSFIHPLPSEDDLAVRHYSHRLRMSSMVGQNPAVHRRTRGLFQTAFAAHTLQAHLRLIVGHCANLADAVAAELRDGQVVDVNATLARPLGFSLVAQTVGVPRADWDWFAAKIYDIVPASESSEEAPLTVADEQARPIADYLRDLRALRTRHPDDDVVSVLAAAHGGSDPPITDDEFVGTVLGLFTGGQAAAAAACAGVLTLLNRPPDRYWLLGSYAQALAYVDELLRHDGIVNFTALPRIATEDVVMSGVPVPAGADVRAGLAAANRDPRAFPNADLFDPDRRLRGKGRASPLTFSAGMHRCLARDLALGEVAILLRAVCTRLPALSLAAEPIWFDSARVRAIRRLVAAAA